MTVLSQPVAEKRPRRALSDGTDPTLVAGKADHVVDTVALAPGHELFPDEAETRVQHDCERSGAEWGIVAGSFFHTAEGTAGMVRSVSLMIRGSAGLRICRRRAGGFGDGPYASSNINPNYPNVKRR
jgi:hypothetical protein